MILSEGQKLIGPVSQDEVTWEILLLKFPAMIFWKFSGGYLRISTFHTFIKIHGNKVHCNFNAKILFTDHSEVKGVNKQENNSHLMYHLAFGLPVLMYNWVRRT